MAAVRAIEQQGVSAGSIVDSLLAEYRQMVPSSKEDVIIADEIRLAQAFIEGLEVEDPELLRFSI
jgi:histidine ammonia-lyase